MMEMLTPYERWLLDLRVGERVQVRHLFSFQTGEAEITKCSVRRRDDDGYYTFIGPTLHMVGGANFFIGEMLAEGHWSIRGGGKSI